MPSERSALDLSIVVPLKDEEANVGPFVEEMRRAIEPLGLGWELVCIDDGSDDGTWGRLVAARAANPFVRIIRFTRNFGQSAAFAAGFAHARGRFVITCDGDLQNDPGDIPRMLQMARSADIVCGWRRQRRDNYLTRYLPSVAANWLIGVVTGVRLHDHGCSLKLFRAEVVRPLHLRPGMHRYLPALASQLGNRIVEIEVHHRPRTRGRSKYGLSRTFRVGADLLRLRRLMREALDLPAAASPPLYEIAERLDEPARETAGCAPGG
jgi:glycosyltransferase involved in cell wall biosynthesis